MLTPSDLFSKRRTDLAQQDLQAQFLEVIREHSGIIHKVCRLYAQPGADSQDLYQDILLQLWRALPRYKGEAKLTTWMYRIALNTAISGLRRTQRDVTTTDLDLQAAPVLTYDPPGLEQEEQLHRLYEAIGQLSEVERALVMLYLDERSYEEMEEVLGLSQGNLRVKMTRIKEKLRQLTKNKTTYGTR